MLYGQTSQLEEGYGSLYVGFLTLKLHTKTIIGSFFPFSIKLEVTTHNIYCLTRNVTALVMM